MGLSSGDQVVLVGTESSVRGASKKKSRGSSALIGSRGEFPVPTAVTGRVVRVPLANVVKYPADRRGSSALKTKGRVLNG